MICSSNLVDEMIGKTNTGQHTSQTIQLQKEGNAISIKNGAGIGGEGEEAYWVLLPITDTWYAFSMIRWSELSWSTLNRYEHVSII